MKGFFLTSWKMLAKNCSAYTGQFSESSRSLRDMIVPVKGNERAASIHCFSRYWVSLPISFVLSARVQWLREILSRCVGMVLQSLRLSRLVELLFKTISVHGVQSAVKHRKMKMSKTNDRVPVLESAQNPCSKEGKPSPNLSWLW